MTPTAPMGALTLADLFSATLATYRRKFWLFLSLALVPLVLLLVVFLVVALVVVLNGWQRLPEPQAAATALTILLVAFVPIYAISLYSVVLSGRAAVATIDLAVGRGEPTWAGLRERTRGLGGRVLLLYLCGVGLALGLMALVTAVVFGVFALNDSRGLALGRDLPAFIGLVLVAGFLLVPVVYALTIKLLYTVVAMAEEGLGPFAALARSWRMTAGAFWRTLGAYLTAAIVVGAVGSLSQLMVFPVSVVPLIRDGGGAWIGVVVSILAGVITLALNAAVMPFSMIWCALMYLGRRREQAGQTVLASWASHTPAPPPPGWL